MLAVNPHLQHLRNSFCDHSHPSQKYLQDATATAPAVAQAAAASSQFNSMANRSAPYTGKNPYRPEMTDFVKRTSAESGPRPSGGSMFSMMMICPSNEACMSA